MGLEPVETSGNTAIPGILAPAATRNKNLAGLRPWQPGISGNPSGRPKSARFRREALKQLRMEIAPGVSRLACIVDSTIERATVETAAYTALRDTVDGKPSSNDDRPTVGTINIAWGAMPAWGTGPTVDASVLSSTVENRVAIDNSSDTVPEVQLKVLDRPPAGPAHTRPAQNRTRLAQRVPAVAVPAPTVPVPPRNGTLSVTRLVAERALAKLAEVDTTGMSPATFKNYLAKVRVAEEALATL